ncbi:MAG: hypothetical protein KC643_21865 [Nitrospira sp.]|nr:hypothetical protein [Nitrospira sp.]
MPKSNDAYRFAAYPSAVVYNQPGTTATQNAVQHLLWGDWLSLSKKKDGSWETDGPWFRVRARGKSGWIHQDDFTKDRLLEVNFVDIGQGDGCLIVTPKDEFIVIDAGEKDNMYRFLKWRFNLKKQDKVNFKAFVITHPDKDHYYGFRDLFAEPSVKVETVYHNGIVERKASKGLGPEKTFNGITYLDDHISTQAQLQKLLRRETRQNSRRVYPELLRAALQSSRVGQIKMLSARDKYLPGYGSGNFRLQVLSPALEQCPDRKPRLRRFGDNGKTKNGHSIVLKLVYDKVSLLLGGDLNIPSENYLLQHYTGIDPDTINTANARKAFVTNARKTFGVDIAKACHHGSSDFRELFLQAVDPIATIISSGDEESYSHPRPDALGTFGRHGRGKRPLIFSTELARSTRETIKNPNRLRQEVDEWRAVASDPQKSPSSRERAKKKVDKILDETLTRSVAIYGMITVRTDGKKAIIAQKLEQPRSNKSKWDIYELLPDSNGGLVYTSKH